MEGTPKLKVKEAEKKGAPVTFEDDVRRAFKDLREVKTEELSENFEDEVRRVFRDLDGVMNRRDAESQIYHLSRKGYNPELPATQGYGEKLARIQKLHQELATPMRGNPESSGVNIGIPPELANANMSATSLTEAMMMIANNPKGMEAGQLGYVKSRVDQAINRFGMKICEDSDLKRF